MRRLAGAARRRLARVLGTGPRVTVVLDGAAALTGLAASLPPRGRPPVELVVVTGPDEEPRTLRVAGQEAVRAATVDDAVASARGAYLVLLGPGDVPLPDAWTAMVEVLEASGSDLVVGDCRTAAPRSWAEELFGRPRTRQDATSCPVALVDLSAANKMFRLQSWRRAGIRLGPGPVARTGPAAVLAAYVAATGFDVLDRVVVHSQAPDRALPVHEQDRFRAPVLAETLLSLRRAAEVAPVGWRTLAATHLLPPLYVDAVGGGADYLEVLSAGIGPLLDGVRREDLPVAARLGGWLALHGTLRDQALLQDLLADHPHGLPVTDGLVPVPDGLSVDPPRGCRAVHEVDRRPRCRVSGRVVRRGARCRLDGATFTEYVDAVPLPEVSLLVDGEAPVPLDVERRHDPRTNEWAARAFEDRSDAGWTAWFDAALLTDAAHERLTVEVLAAGVRSRHRVEIPRTGPAAATEVHAVSLREGVLSVAGATDQSALTAVVTGARGSTASVPLQVADGRFTGAVPLVTAAFGARVRLPVGRYRLRLEGADGRSAAATWSPALLADPPELVDARQRVTVSGDRDSAGPVLRVRAPLRALERGAFAQQQLRSRLYAAPSAPAYDRTVLLETFRGRSVGDNPGAIGRELLSRDLGLDLAWVVDDPGVVVPDGTRAVVRRSEGWYDVLANARAYVANAGAPYWFEKKPGQIHLQTWHGTPLKRIGEDRGPGDFETWRHRRRLNAQAAGWDAMLSSGPYCSAAFRSAFHYEGELWETGYPRNDVLLAAGADEVRDRVRRELGVRAADRVVLYAPTWRSHLGERQSKPLFLDAAQVVAASEDLVVLVRGHYTATDDAEAFAGHPRVHDVTRHPDIAELYLAADVLVTDYSSVMFDFVLTDKPMVLLTPDLEQYRKVERGFYVDLEERAPGPLTRSTDEVLDVLSGPDADGGRRARFRAAFAPHEQGRSAAQAVDRLLELW